MSVLTSRLRVGGARQRRCEGIVFVGEKTRKTLLSPALILILQGATLRSLSSTQIQCHWL
jgi:hypothetical protein